MLHHYGHRQFQFQLPEMQLFRPGAKFSSISRQERCRPPPKRTLDLVSENHSFPMGEPVLPLFENPFDPSFPFPDRQRGARNSFSYPRPSLSDSGHAGTTVTSLALLAVSRF